MYVGLVWASFVQVLEVKKKQRAMWYRGTGVGSAVIGFRIAWASGQGHVYKWFLMGLYSGLESGS